MKWNLRWAAARRDIWRPSQLLAAFEKVGFTPSLSKVAALWGSKPISVRLDDLDKICAALNCQVADLMEAEPLAVSDDSEQDQRAVGAGDERDRRVRPAPKRGRGAARRSLPPN